MQRAIDVRGFDWRALADYSFGDRRPTLSPDWVYIACASVCDHRMDVLNVDAEGLLHGHSCPTRDATRQQRGSCLVARSEVWTNGTKRMLNGEREIEKLSATLEQ